MAGAGRRGPAPRAGATTAARAGRGSTPWAAAIALGLAAVAPYLPALANDLVWDDRLHLVDNPRLDGVGAALSYLWLPEGIYHRPLVFLSYALQRQLGADSAALLHLGNLALHGFNAALLFLVAARTGVPAAAAACGALLFAWHPLQSEAVAYVSGRTDLLVAAASLAALVAVLGRQGESPARALARGSAAAAATAAAIASKESGYALPLFLAWVVWHRPAPARTRLALVGPAFVVAALLLLLRPAALPPIRLEPLAALADAGRTAAVYGRLLLWPADLEIDRLTPVAQSLPATLGFSVLGLALAAAVGLGLRRSTVTSTWTAWAAVFYLPIANFVPLYGAIAGRALFTPEHNLYLPIAGLAVLAAAGSFAAAERRRATRLAGALCVFVLVAYGGRTWARMADWRDEATLFARAAAAGSLSPRVWYNLGNAQMQAGRRGAAVSAYGRAVQLAPADAEAWMNLGVALQLEGRYGDALAAYERALAAGPSPQLYRNLASLHRARGDLAAARAALAKAEELSEPR